MKTNKNGYSKVPEEVTFEAALIATDVRVYSALRSYRNEKIKGPVYPSRHTIADRLHCSVDTIDRSIQRLVQSGYLTYAKGSKGRGVANTYYFPDGSDSKGRTNAAPLASFTPTKGGFGAGEVSAPTRLQSESVNQNHESGRKVRLFHGEDLASVFEDGSIRIRTYRGEWVDYGGNDDGAFRFGVLTGKAAKDAALTRFAHVSKTDTVSSLPTDGEASQPTRSQPGPSTTESP